MRLKENRGLETEEFGHGWAKVAITKQQKERM